MSLSYLDKYVFIVRVPYLCLMGITCLRCELLFLVRVFTMQIEPPANRNHHSFTLHIAPLHTRVQPRMWAEISIASDRDSAQEGRGVPLVQSRTEGDFPTTPRPMRVEIATEGDFHTTPRPMRVEIATEGDFPTTPRPMRVEMPQMAIFSPRTRNE